MKTTNIPSKSIAAATALVLLAGTVHAASLLNGTTGAGELFVGLRASAGQGLAKNVVIDLGSVSALSLLPAGSVVTLGNIGTDLTAQYGASWWERTDLAWSAVAGVASTATADPTSTLYGGVSANGLFPLSTVGYTRAANNAQLSIANLITSMASGANGFTVAATGATSNIAIENTGDANSWSSKFGASPFNGFATPSGQVFEQAFTVGAVAPGVEGALDVYRMFKTGTADGDLGGATTGPGSYQLTLEIDQSGVIKGNVLPVPEPASIGLLMSGGMLFLASRRRSMGGRARQ